MIVFPHAKLNLGLQVTSRRPDGFHNLNTIFLPIRLRDVLEVNKAEKLSIYQTGLQISGKVEDNLVIRAFELIKRNHPKAGFLEIRLHKAIPTGAGLGGGSSDATCMLKAINQFYHLEIPDITLLKYALELGSDCPFFLKSGPCYATGRGEILEPLEIDLSLYSILVIHPQIHIGTAWAFSKIKPRPADFDLTKLVSEPIKNWRDLLSNDFEIPVFKEYPAIRKIKESLYAGGALYASLTGSGSVVYGIFPKNAIPDFTFENAIQYRIDENQS